MITGAIALVILIGTIAAAGNNEWGSVAVGAVLIVLVLWFGIESREQDRAYNNFVSYWARGGAMHDSGGTRIEQKVVVQNRIMPNISPAHQRTESIPVCWRCGSGMPERERTVYAGSGTVVTHVCPKCGEVKKVRI